MLPSFQFQTKNPLLGLAAPDVCFSILIELEIISGFFSNNFIASSRLVFPGIIPSQQGGLQGMPFSQRDSQPCGIVGVGIGLTVGVAVGRGAIVTVDGVGVLVVAGSEPQAESRVKIKNSSRAGNFADIAKTPGV